MLVARSAKWACDLHLTAFRPRKEYLMEKPFVGDGKVLTGANVLCVIRVILACITAWLISVHQPQLAFWCAVVGVLTDLFDGFIAKRGWLGGRSELGKIIDPIADKTMILVPVLAILWTFVRDNRVSEFVFWFLAATFVIIVLRELAVWRFKVGLAKRFGVESAIESARASMAFQSVGLLVLVLTALDDDVVAAAAISAMLTASLVAGWDYFKRWRTRQPERILQEA